MKKSNKEFVRDLLSSDSVSSEVKKRIFQLATEERVFFNENPCEMEVRISRLEKVICKLENLYEENNEEKFLPSLKEKNNKIGKNKTPRHRPKETYKFMNAFSNNERGLKNLTHSFNKEFIKHEKFIGNCKKEYENLIASYENVPNALKTRIEHFAFKKEPEWFIRKGKERIPYKIGWSQPQFVKWYKKNKIHPDDDAKYQKKMINPFKDTIQVRADTRNLIKLINEVSELVFQERDFDIKITKSVCKAHFYTDVDKLGEAFWQIFKGIKKAVKRSFSQDIKINFTQSKPYKILKIAHLDSTPSKAVNDKDFIGGNIKSVKNSLWGLCNYEIHAKFSNGCFRKVILSDNKNDFSKDENGKTDYNRGKVYELEEKQVKGFTHVLKFY